MNLLETFSVKMCVIIIIFLEDLHSLIFLQKIKTQLDDCTPIDVKIKELQDYFMTDAISRASPTMAKCVQAVLKQKQSKY